MVLLWFDGLGKLDVAPGTDSLRSPEALLVILIVTHNLRLTLRLPSNQKNNNNKSEKILPKFN